VTTIRSDGVNPGFLGMDKIVSEDSLRRSLSKIQEEPGVIWLQKHFKKRYEPLLFEPWVMDVDTTVKVLYGKQERAVAGIPLKGLGGHSTLTIPISWQISDLFLMLRFSMEIK